MSGPLTITCASTMFAPGQRVTLSGLTPHLPRWVLRWPWQDGDRAIVAWFYRITGRPLPSDNGTFTVTAVKNTEFEVE